MRKMQRVKRQQPKASAASKPAVAIARLNFPPSPGTVTGFNASSLSSFDAGQSASCVRELVQNSLDAALVEAHEDSAVVRFVVEDHKIEDIPGMGDYRQALDSAIEIAANSQSRDVAHLLQTSSRKQKAKVLFVMDNGVGFDPTRLCAMLSDGVSVQSKEETRGAFGVGHLTAFALSNLRYVFYGSIPKEGKTAFSGHAILASHYGPNARGKKVVCGEHGYFVRKIRQDRLDSDRFEFPDESEAPAFLRAKMEEVKTNWGHGAIIAIVGFNDFGGEESPAEVVLREVALNFYVAVERDKLRVEFCHDGHMEILDRDKLQAILDGRKENVRGQKGFPSGRRVWDSHQTLLLGKQYSIDTPHGKIDLRLNRGGKSRHVAICRNGMWISDQVRRLLPSDFGDRKPFDALLLIDAETSGKAHDLIKLAENPLHNVVDAKRINNRSHRRDLRDFLRVARENINDLVEKKTDESFSPSEIIPIQFGDSMRGGSSSRMQEAVKIGSRGLGRGANGKGRKRTPGAVRSGQMVPVKMSSRRVGEGRVLARLESHENCEDVRFRLALDDGSDETCAGVKRSWVFLRRVCLAGEEVAPENYLKNEQGKIVAVRLGKWDAGKHYQLEVDYDAPDKELYTLIYDFASRKPAPAANRAEPSNE